MPSLKAQSQSNWRTSKKEDSIRRLRTRVKIKKSIRWRFLANKSSQFTRMQSHNQNSCSRKTAIRGSSSGLSMKAIVDSRYLDKSRTTYGPMCYAKSKSSSVTTAQISGSNLRTMEQSQARMIMHLHLYQNKENRVATKKSRWRKFSSN